MKERIRSSGLNILLLTANERSGGAGVAATRLRDGMLELGHQVDMFVQSIEDGHPRTLGPQGGLMRTFNRTRSDLDAVPVRWCGGSPAHFSSSWLPRFYPALPDTSKYDIVHLHWTNAGFLSIKDVAKLRVPVVWTLHDMWPFTGGCQYDNECGRYEVGCGECPILGSTKRRDLSASRFSSKLRNWRENDITFVAPSYWMAREAKRSQIGRNRSVEVIKNGLDLRRFRPVDRRLARQVLDLPEHAHLVLYGALNATSDTRKGYDLLQQAASKLNASVPADADLFYVVFGSGVRRVEESVVNGRPSRTFHLGKLSDEYSLILAYSACDVFVAPSRQENLANTLAESMACGLPCVAFDIGGMPDLITHQQNGYLATPFDSNDLADGIGWCLWGQMDDGVQLSCNARLKAELELDLLQQSDKYLRLFRDVSRIREAIHV